MCDERGQPLPSPVTGARMFPDGRSAAYRQGPLAEAAALLTLLIYLGW
jgi:hypothetical protein